MAVTAIVRLDARPDCMDVLCASMQDAAGHAQSNPDCELIEATRAANGDPVVYLYEQWSSQAALDAHAGTEYMQDLLAKLPDWLTQSPQVVIAKPLEG
ncbi:antibiotic biosynthesis monooxygenase [Novosphingobium sp. YJ-S2-02]|uniref:Antibiotic biosynthesis monooxygenase n=1 Tax=Novosphingobium aureum TaxID=2792964 RepID=A0A931ML20_9SPHN|nr:antibiotic biosynthesis monooxygenase [Novosphingobium aureum]MBH0113542.1 antibiotic biosynthesis monooxygenase [Novosphingobium aureum]